jgi:hypothetical protein
MMYVAEWDSMLFLACPIMKDLNNLIWSGLFINDLRLRTLTASCFQNSSSLISGKESQQPHLGELSISNLR